MKRAGSRGSNGSSSGGSGSSSGGSGSSSVGSSGSSAGSDAEDSAGNGRGNGRGHGGGAGASRLEEDGEIGYRSLASMPYLTATITEILRLHPSVPLDFKTATRDGVLPDGTRIRKNERVMFVPYAMGRMSELWDRPHEFDPTRHLDADSGAFRFPNAFRFPVFLAGPRMCLGKDMAYLGAGMMLTSLLERYDVSLAQSPERAIRRGHHALDTDRRSDPVPASRGRRKAQLGGEATTTFSRIVLQLRLWPLVLQFRWDVAGEWPQSVSHPAVPPDCS